MREETDNGAKSFVPAEVMGTGMRVFYILSRVSDCSYGAAPPRKQGPELDSIRPCAILRGVSPLPSRDEPLRCAARRAG